MVDVLGFLFLGLGLVLIGAGTVRNTESMKIVFGRYCFGMVLVLGEYC